MELFVYHWYYNGYNIYGHSLQTNGDYKLIHITDYKPSCFIEGESVPSCRVHKHKIIHRRMVTSRDISETKWFCQVFFDNIQDMKTFVSEIKCTAFMADIQQIDIFLSQKDIDHVGWIKVDVQAQTYKQDDIHPVKNKLPYASPKLFIFDLEVKSSDQGMPQAYRYHDTVEMISVIIVHNNEIQHKYILHVFQQLDIPEEILFENETELILGFFKLILSENPTVITGYNIFNFDFKYLVSRLQLKLLEIPPVSRGTGSVNIINVNWKNESYGYNTYDRLVIPGRIILDMFVYFKRLKLDKYSLNFVAEYFLKESKHDMDHLQMMKAFQTKSVDQLRLVAEYCIQDSVLVYKLFKEMQMWIDVCEISKITRCSIEEIYTRGEHMKITAQCVKESILRQIVLQPQPKQEAFMYEGAFVFEPTKGVYNNCVLVDFQSLYPSLIIAFNICPSTYTNKKFISHNKILNHMFRKQPLGLLPGLVKKLLDERNAVKTTMKTLDTATLEYQVLHRRQNALKMCANSVYGMMGTPYSKYFGHRGAAESVTAKGREVLNDVIESIKSTYPIQVIYGDTDSCLLTNDTLSKDELIKLCYKICKEITEKLPHPMALLFEEYCRKAILLTKKRYILVTDTKTKYKGVMSARRDYCKYAKILYISVLDKIIADEDSTKISKYIDKQMILLKRGNIPASNLVITKNINKKLEDYKINAPHVLFARQLDIPISAGTRLEYLFIKDDTKFSQAEKMILFEKYDYNCHTIDYDYYIEKQLVNQLDDILSLVKLDNYMNNNWTSNKKR